MARRKYSVQEKLNIVLNGLRVNDQVSSLCRSMGISPYLYYRWKKEFIEGGIRALSGKANGHDREPEIMELKRIIGDLTIQVEVLKKLQGQ
jgi:transposase-like protein